MPLFLGFLPTLDAHLLPFYDCGKTKRFTSMVKSFPQWTDKGEQLGLGRDLRVVKQRRKYLSISLSISRFPAAKGLAIDSAVG